MRAVAALGATVLVLVMSMAAWSAEQPAAPARPPQQEAKTAGGAAAAKFQQILAGWKPMLQEMRNLRSDYKKAEPKRRGEIRKQYNQLVQKAEAMQVQLLEAGEKAFVESPNADPYLTQLLVDLSMQALQQEDYEESLRLTRLLIAHQVDLKQLYGAAAFAAFNVGEFEEAEKFAKVAREAKVLNEDGERHIQDLGYYREVWSKEAELRAKEAKADDLPRVLMKTNKGGLELELFENQAPIAVANFISLVDKGFYNGLTFHRVLPKFMAQGGCPRGDGMGGPGYTIPCECYQPNHRLHFRGTLSMAHAGRDTGGSQFFLTFVPVRHLDGRHTAFGRVIKGMEVLAKIQRRDPSEKDQPEPDKILEAKVLRKRDHPYEPKKLVE